LRPNIPMQNRYGLLNIPEVKVLQQKEMNINIGSTYDATPISESKTPLLPTINKYEYRVPNTMVNSPKLNTPRLELGFKTPGR
jgi:hypothetical protein